jgi:hypothetical protein
MARNTMDFAQQNTERAVQATNWMRAIAEQNLNQSKAAFEGLLTVARNAVRSIDQHSSAIREHSLAVAEQTLSNAFDFAHKVIRMKEPQELAQIQSDFVSRQAQVPACSPSRRVWHGSRRPRLLGAYARPASGRRCPACPAKPRTSCEGWSLTEGPDWLALRLNKEVRC